MKKDNPCHHCEERETGCHSVCEKYQRWSEKHQQELREERKKREEYNTLRSFYVESGLKIKKERKEK